LVPFDDVNAEAFRSKHPSRTYPGNLPPTPNTSCLLLQQIDILAAIKSFMPGSAGGNDGLRPQYRKDLTIVHRRVMRVNVFCVD